MLDKVKVNKLTIWFLICSHFLSLNLIDGLHYAGLYTYAILLLYFYFLCKYSSKVQKFKSYLCFFFIALIANYISSYINRGQGIFQSLVASSEILDILFIYIVASINPSKEELLCLMRRLVIIVLLAYYIQILIYPIAIFANSDAEWVTSADYVYRNLIVGCQHVISLGCFLFINRYISKHSIRDLLLAFLCVIPFFIRGFRITIVGCFAGLLYLYYKTSKNSNILEKTIRFIIFLLMGYVLFYVLYISIPVVQTSIDMLVERASSSETNLSDDDYIRTINITYHYTNHFQNPFEFIFGTGLPNPHSDYGLYYYNYIYGEMHINYVDWGLLGLTWYLGIPAVGFIIYIIFKGIKTKVNPEYAFVGAWFLYSLIFSITDPEIYNNHSMIITAIGIYFVYKCKET